MKQFYGHWEYNPNIPLNEDVIDKAKASLGEDYVGLIISWCQRHGKNPLRCLYNEIKLYELNN